MCWWGRGASAAAAAVTLRLVSAALLLAVAQCDKAPDVSGPRNAPAIWLYLGVPAHFPGSAVQLKHYLHHYFDILGFPTATFVCTVNFKSDQEFAAREYQAVNAELRARNLTCVEWMQEYDARLHHQIRLRLLAERGVALHDWVVVTDLDEFHAYPILPVARFLDSVDSKGYNVVIGQFVDRITKDGSLPDIDPTIDLAVQFPRKCKLKRSFGNAATTKVVAAKGFWRSAAGNHRIVTDAATATQDLGSLGLLDVTPYGWHPECYDQRLERTAASPCGKHVYTRWRYPLYLPVDHYKWHSGVLANVERRLHYYRGDDIGAARFYWYKESEALFNHLMDNSLQLNVRSLPGVACW